jgi:GTPase SAR1 family protein
MPPSIAPASRVRADLDALADAVDAATFRFSGDDERLEHRDRVSALIRRYLVPRLADPEGPLLVALFGSTGSGKSTIVNSLAGRDVTAAGALRPTTRAATVWCHRDNVADLARLEATGEVAFVTDDHPDLRWLSVVDTPDVDSIVTSHRRQTERILGMADATIHVTTPQRYADAVPWEFLERMARRDVPMLIVTNRLARRSSGAVTDLASLLRKERIVPGISSDQIVAISEQRLKQHGRLPASAIKRINAYLQDLAGDHSAVVRRSVRGGIQTAVDDIDEILADLERQRAEVAAMADAIDVAVSQQSEEISAQLEQGDLVGAEVLQRWRRLIGVSDLASVVARGVGRLRDILVPSDAVPASTVEQVGREARDAMIDIAILRVRRAHEAIVTAWRLEPSGARLVDGDLLRPKEDREAAGEEIDAWLASLVDLVAEQGQRRFRLARAASVGVNAAASMLLLAIFSTTGGLTGAEVGVTAGAAAAQQSLLEHLFGGAAARRLAETAQRDLIERLSTIVAVEGDRFRDVLDAVADPSTVAETIDQTRATVIKSASEWLDG